MNEKGSDGIFIFLLILSILVLAVGLIIVVGIPVIQEKLIDPISKKGGNDRNQEIQDCLINSAYWEFNSQSVLVVGENENVAMIVEGENCEGVILNYEIYNEQDVLVSSNGQSGFVDGIFRKIWNTNAGAFYFVARTDSGELEIASSILNVDDDGIFEICSDGIDDDLDGLIDCDDPDCDNSPYCSGDTECSDGIDNDGDGKIDYPNDFGCTSHGDKFEINNGTTQCSDGIDNDGDGDVDQNDAGCLKASDDSESESIFLSECADGLDNDGDGKIDWGFATGNDPDCTSGFDVESPSTGNRIDWDLFPEFNLNNEFTLVFGGIPFDDGDDFTQALSHGFTNVDLGAISRNDLGSQNIDSRFYLWTGISAPCRSQNQSCIPPSGSSVQCDRYFPSQPWEVSDFVGCDIYNDQCGECSFVNRLLSPFNNSLDVYDTFWDTRLSWAPRSWNGDRPLNDVRDLDNYLEIISPDIESHRSDSDNPRDDSGILEIKNRPEIPEDIRSLSNEEFIEAYKKKMAEMYYQPTKFLRDNGYTGIISGYADVPIERTWFGLESFSWEDWTTDWSLVNYVMKDFESSNFESSFGPVYDGQDWLSPSGYMFYDDRPGNLAYALFQIEVNKAWTESEGSNKPIFFWYWLNYHSCCNFDKQPINSYTAHALGIFPYMSGASASHDWIIEDVGPEDVANYHQFIYGLYRLSEYNYMFDGNYELVIETPAYYSFNRKVEPVAVGDRPEPLWRGVVNSNRDKILIAAQNPYAFPNEVTQIDVSYGSFSKTIEVEGKNVYLEVFDL